MTPLIHLEPMKHAELGIEAFGSFLDRLADMYGVSRHQLLRFLCESTEVSNLVDEAPFRAVFDSPRSLSGYAASAQSLARRVEAATGVQGVAAMTIKRVGPALASNGVGALASKRRYCPQCLNEMKCLTSGIIWEPLVWALPSLTCCPVHSEPLHQALSERGILVSHMQDIPNSEWTSRRDACEDWQRAESLKLVTFCAEEPDDLVIDDAPRVFLNEYMQYRHMELADFTQITGLSYGNLKRQAMGELGFTLKTVFNIAQRLALSPTEILAEPIEAARKDTLFSAADHADQISKAVVPQMCRNHAKSVYKELVQDVEKLLASEQLLPSLRRVCHARGVSTSYARYRMPAHVAKFMARRRCEKIIQRAARRKEADQVAEAAFAEAGSQPFSLKRTERLLRQSTGLPKHLLSPALREVVVRRCK